MFEEPASNAQKEAAEMKALEKQLADFKAREV
jgi:hypothetical protein